MKKQQVGKTQTNQLYDKISVEVKRPLQIRRCPTVPISTTTSSNGVEKSSSSTEKVMYIVLDSVPESATVEETVGGIESSSSAELPTDLRTTRLKVIMDTLTMVHLRFCSYIETFHRSRFKMYPYILSPDISVCD